MGLILGLNTQVLKADEVSDLRARVETLERRVNSLEQQQRTADKLENDMDRGQQPLESQPQEKAMRDSPASVAPLKDNVAAQIPGSKPEYEVETQTLASGNKLNKAWGKLFLFQGQGRLNPEQSPDAEGMLPYSGAVSFDPEDYGLDGSSLINTYDDPSLYPAVAVHLKGFWKVGKDGPYQLSVVTKPAREGGEAVRSSLTYKLLVDGEEIMPETTTRRWQTMKFDLNLQAGDHLTEIYALARSPGFGPSPVDSRIIFKVRGPGDAAFYPLEFSKLPNNFNPQDSSVFHLSVSAHVKTP